MSRKHISYGGKPKQEYPDFEANWNHRISSFDDMHLKPELAHCVFSYG